MLYCVKKKTMSSDYSQDYLPSRSDYNSNRQVTTHDMLDANNRRYDMATKHTMVTHSPVVQTLSHLDTLSQEQIHKNIGTDVKFKIKQIHVPIAIVIGIVVFLVLVVILYLATQMRFKKIVDEKVPKVDCTAANAPCAGFNLENANKTLKSSITGMDGLQLALLIGSAGVSMGCAFAYIMSKKNSELMKSFDLHARMASNLQDKQYAQSMTSADYE